MIATYISKQEALDTDLKAIQQISLTGNLTQVRSVNDNTAMFFIIEEAKETI